MTRPTVVVLCEHGEAKPHGGFDDDGAIWEPCPGGRVLNQAIIIERDENGEWPKWATKDFYHVGVDSADDILDALASAQEQT